MSKSNASAKSRRAFIDTTKQNQFNPSIPTSSPTPAQPSTGLTLQQVISVIDKRLINVETFMKESKEESSKRVNFEDENQDNDKDTYDNNNELNNIIIEYNSRFALLAEEISNIKDTLLKLQTYTMSVNKTLMEERIQLISDLGNIVSEPNYEINNTVVENHDVQDNVKEEIVLNTPIENNNNIQMDNFNVSDIDNATVDNSTVNAATDTTEVIGNGTIENKGIKINNTPGINFRRNRNNLVK
uniref:Uncharacterized protein n=1 Tax=viral metagenome TaxID=1070528 RepID=A0A6C0HSK6_9ZZZZ